MSVSDSQPTAARSTRFRIIGQGLTGSLLALELHRRGLPFLVQDTPLPATATPVAPGIVNPMAGRKFKAPNGIKDLLQQLHQTMGHCHQLLGQSFWHPLPILRVFFEDSQLERFHAALQGPGFAFVQERYPENHFPYLHDDLGSFLTQRGGWTDLAALQRAVRSWLADSGNLLEEEWDPRQPAQADEWRIFCEGWRVTQNPLWDFVPHNPARGDMLIVRFSDAWPRDRIVNQSCWAQPIDNDLWRIGATYGWDDFSDQPSPKAARDLQERLRLLTPVPFTVLDQKVGVRPIVEDTKPVLGTHPTEPRTAILNAMGSKGVLQAPSAVQAFAAFLFDNQPLPADWSVARFL